MSFELPVMLPVGYNVRDGNNQCLSQVGGCRKEDQGVCTTYILHTIAVYHLDLVHPLPQPPYPSLATPVRHTLSHLGGPARPC